jgi:hypothetical protein
MASDPEAEARRLEQLIVDLRAQVMQQAWLEANAERVLP